MKFLYYIIHTFIDCPDKDLKNLNKSAARCEKCGRTIFIFNTYK